MPPLLQAIGICHFKKSVAFEKHLFLNRYCFWSVSTHSSGGLDFNNASTPNR